MIDGLVAWEAADRSLETYLANFGDLLFLGAICLVVGAVEVRSSSIDIGSYCPVSKALGMTHPTCLTSESDNDKIRPERYPDNNPKLIPEKSTANFLQRHTIPLSASASKHTWHAKPCTTFTWVSSAGDSTHTSYRETRGCSGRIPSLQLSQAKRWDGIEGRWFQLARPGLDGCSGTSLEPL